MFLLSSLDGSFHWSRKAGLSVLVHIQTSYMNLSPRLGGILVALHAQTKIRPQKLAPLSKCSPSSIGYNILKSDIFLQLNETFQRPTMYQVVNNYQIYCEKTNCKLLQYIIIIVNHWNHSFIHHRRPRLMTPHIPNSVPPCMLGRVSSYPSFGSV